MQRLTDKVREREKEMFCGLCMCVSFSLGSLRFSKFIEYRQYDERLRLHANLILCTALAVDSHKFIESSPFHFRFF